jgi:hypothetical protein
MYWAYDRSQLVSWLQFASQISNDSRLRLAVTILDHELPA